MTAVSIKNHRLGRWIVFGNTSNPVACHFGRAIWRAELPRIRAFDGFAREELEYAILASSVMSPSSHRIGILMSSSGRFLVCRDCKSSVQFPDGAQYGAIASQFEFRSCSLPDRRFVIARYEGKVPVMASCTKCKHRFFTPSSNFVPEATAAERYWASKSLAVPPRSACAPPPRSSALASQSPALPIAPSAPD
jgi:hypothetical protein